MLRDDSQAGEREDGERTADCGVRGMSLVFVVAGITLAVGSGICSNERGASFFWLGGFVGGILIGIGIAGLLK